MPREPYFISSGFKATICAPGNNPYPAPRQGIFRAMCRHAAYLGPSLSLERFLLRPDHGLVEQAYRPREMLTAELNADGFGFGWYHPETGPGTYTNPMPIWSDVNLAHLGPAMSSNLWIANVRSATRGQPTNQANTHPFRAGGLLFSHNGFVRDFAETLRPTLRAFVRPEFDSEIRGNTDSEHLFAALRHVLAQDVRAQDDSGIETALRRLFDRLAQWLDAVPALLNFLVADGQRIIATRHAIDHESPSLYYGRDVAAFGEGWLIASEPLTEAGEWEPVPDHHFVTLGADGPPRLSAL